MVEVFKDYIPGNARIIVDYKAKEKVKFSFPIEWTYKKAVWKRAFPTIFMFWLIANIYVYLILGTLAIIGVFIYSSFHPIIVKTAESIEKINPAFFLYLIPAVLLYLFYLYGVPILITLWLASDKERMSNYLPRIGHWQAIMLGAMKEKTFEPKDIQDNKAILYHFSNVYLEYDTEGDFDKYLTKVEILEIPFDYRRRIWFFKHTRMRNDFDFRAVFYFSQTPKKGKMEVQFR